MADRAPGLLVQMIRRKAESAGGDRLYEHNPKRTALSRNPGEVFAVELARPAIALMMRRMLFGIKRPVQRETNDSASRDFCP